MKKNAYSIYVDIIVLICIVIYHNQTKNIYKNLKRIIKSNYG